MERKVVLLLVILISTASIATGVSYMLISGKQGSNSGSEQSPEEKTKNVSVLNFKSYNCFDEGLAAEAFSIVVPSGWQFQGGITWRKDRPLLPVSLAFSVINPNSSEGLECFADQAYFWVEAEGLYVPYDYGPETRAQYAQQYQGYEARQPIPAAEYIEEILIPHYRGGAVNLSIESSVSLSNSALVAKLINLLKQRPQGPFPESIAVDAAEVHVKYEIDGKEIEEEFFAIIVVDSFYTTHDMEQMTGVRMNSTFWYASGLWSIKAEGEKLSSDNAKLLMAISHSFRWNPAWLEGYEQLLTDLWQRHLKGIMEQNQALTQAQNEVERTISATFTNQEEAMEHISDEWSSVIRGVETYDESPGLSEFTVNEQLSIELPNGYDYAWTNGQEDYILTNNANFNPNIDLQTNYNWHILEKKP
jgi:hypothetical protein